MASSASLVLQWANSRIGIVPVSAVSGTSDRRTTTLLLPLSWITVSAFSKNNFCITGLFHVRFEKRSYLAYDVLSSCLDSCWGCVFPGRHFFVCALTSAVMHISPLLRQYVQLRWLGRIRQSDVLCSYLSQNTSHLCLA